MPSPADSLSLFTLHSIKITGAMAPTLIVPDSMRAWIEVVWCSGGGPLKFGPESWVATDYYYPIDIKQPRLYWHVRDYPALVQGGWIADPEFVAGFYLVHWASYTGTFFPRK